MKKRISPTVAAMLGGLFWAAPAFTQTKICSLEVRDYGEFVMSGNVHKIQVIPKKTDSACLISYAAKMCRERPGVRFEFFDAQSNDLNAYIRGMRLLESGQASNVLRDNIPVEYQYSDKWWHKHHVATLWASSDVQHNSVVGENGCQQWFLKSEDGKTLATFDQICPAR